MVQTDRVVAALHCVKYRNNISLTMYITANRKPTQMSIMIKMLLTKICYKFAAIFP